VLAPSEIRSRAWRAARRERDRHARRKVCGSGATDLAVSPILAGRGKIEPMAEPSLNDVLEFALALSREAGQFILPRWKNVAVDYKADGSEVTEADRGAEQLLRRRIGERYPDHAILGEEFGGDRVRDAEHLWLLDPVDGTASFAMGLPLFATLIGYLRRGAACVGVIGAHALGETVYAAAGQGCWYQREGGESQRVRTSAVTDPAEAFVVSTALENTDLDPGDRKASVCLSRLYRQARRFRWSGDCINYALLCQGAYRRRARPTNESVGHRRGCTLRAGSGGSTQFAGRKRGYRLAAQPGGLGYSDAPRQGFAVSSAGLDWSRRPRAVVLPAAPRALRTAGRERRRPHSDVLVHVRRR